MYKCIHKAMRHTETPKKHSPVNLFGSLPTITRRRLPNCQRFSLLGKLTVIWMKGRSPISFIKWHEGVVIIIHNCKTAVHNQLWMMMTTPIKRLIRVLLVLLLLIIGVCKHPYPLLVSANTRLHVWDVTTSHNCNSLPVTVHKLLISENRPCRPHWCSQDHKTNYCYTSSLAFVTNLPTARLHEKYTRKMCSKHKCRAL